MTLIVLAVVLPALLYVILSLPAVQNRVRERAEEILSQQIDAEVSIGEVVISPFNRVLVRDASVVCEGDTVMKVRRLGAGMNLTELLLHSRLTFNFAEIRGLDVRLWRDSASTPLNIQPIIDKLTKKDEQKPPAKFNFRVNTVVIRDSRLSYDVWSEPVTPGRFNASHIAVSELRADITAPLISNDAYDVELRRFDFREQSGLELTDFSAFVILNESTLAWNNVVMSLNRSHIKLADGSIEIDGLKGLPSALRQNGVDVEVLPFSRIYLPDLAPFAGALSDADVTLGLRMKGHFSERQISIDTLQGRLSGGQMSFALSDVTVDNLKDATTARVHIPDMEVSVNQSLLNLTPAGTVSTALRSRLPSSLRLTGSADLGLLDGEIKAGATADGGVLDFAGAYRRSSTDAPIEGSLELNSRDFDLAKTLAMNDFGGLTADVEADFTLGKQLDRVEAKAHLSDFTYRRHSYDDIMAEIAFDAGDFSGGIVLKDDMVRLHADVEGYLDKEESRLEADIVVDDMDLYGMNITSNKSVRRIRGRVGADLLGTSIDAFEGTIMIDDLKLTNDRGESLHFDPIVIENDNYHNSGLLTVNSSLLSGHLVGDYRFTSLVSDMRDILCVTFPTLLGTPTPTEQAKVRNTFHFDFSMSDTEPYREFFALPVSAIYPVDINGYFDSEAMYAEATVDAPYLRQGNKLIENTRLTAVLDGAQGRDNLFATTRIPVKQGIMDVNLEAVVKADSADVNLHWKIDRPELYEGMFSLRGAVSRLPDQRLLGIVNILPTQQVFNDTAWQLAPATLSALDGRITVDGFELGRSGQYVTIDGVASASPDDTLTVNVLNLNLDYIFESIGITNVQLGGDATGVITASALLSSAPRMETDGIEVTNISYNKCVLGNATVLSHWNADHRSVVIDGTIRGDSGYVSKVEGEIFALRDSLDINLKADHVPCGFMEYYMQAFASEVSGIGTGNAHLWGTFHDIDMEGEVYVENLALKLNFTNTFFYATDSLHIRPGSIELRDITLSDMYGHTALLNGEVSHEFFRNPTFKFDVTDADNLLVYDESSKQNPDWYGRIFARGKASVDGVPGLVKIDVDVTTSPGSTFTFVLSELEEADEYTFLTFRDKSTLTVEQTDTIRSAEMATVNRLRELLARRGDETSSDYVVDLRVGITPEAEIDLVMDPVAGDRIRSHGSGDLRMLYTSKDNDLRMWGKYTLDKGYYNFTLQDIIIKDFIIREGSSISFTGDPLVAKLDIDAVYSLNANLSDLDESFLQDKDLNRTNVPVLAVLKVTGDIQQPEIKFDLEFPTLTSDIDRKVRSIISTEEMMNRQIIYLLALNRFYTPDYMTATKGNELVSVASSTLSSQLTNILGQLSDNWAIAPNLRSDRGDFSDVEVDVALTSRLLNNRLLLNGNFGYRDKSLNSNQFIGDFDLEYLLNRAGSIRLKAYSHYNDQNYYLRTATTTQGVGIMFKRDFDSFSSWLRPLRRKAKTDEPADSTAVAVERDSVAADSVPAAIVPVEGASE